MQEHLDDNRVYDLLQGALTPDGLAQIHAHISECSSCREIVAEAVKSSTELAPTSLGSPRPEAEPVRIVIRDGKVSRKRVSDPPPPPAARPNALDLAPGAVVADRYRLDRKLGEGGSGVVWAATHTMMKREVALKFLKTARPDAVKRFLREARVSSTLRHPNIVEVHDVFILPGRDVPVMVMDLLHGESLGTKLRRQGSLGQVETAKTLLPVVRALGAAHALGIVHRDLKPENIFLLSAPTGTEGPVRVLDFGLAKLTATEGSLASTGRITKSGVVVGTPHYLAPEQLTPDVAVDHAVDVWALGVVVFECMAGRKPFEARGLPQLFKQIATIAAPSLDDAVPGVRLSLSSLVSRMLDKTPGKRPALDEIEDVLVHCAAGEDKKSRRSVSGGNKNKKRSNTRS